MSKNRVPNAEWRHEWRHAIPHEFPAKKHPPTRIRWFYKFHGILGPLWTPQCEMSWMSVFSAAVYPGTGLELVITYGHRIIVVLPLELLFETKNTKIKLQNNWQWSSCNFSNNSLSIGTCRHKIFNILFPMVNIESCQCLDKARASKSDLVNGLQVSTTLL